MPRRFAPEPSEPDATLPRPPPHLSVARVRVDEVMTARVRTIGRRETARVAANFMRDGHIQHLVVVDVAGRVCGVLSDRDLRAVAPSPLRHADTPDDPLAKLRVEQLMAANPVSVRPSDDVAEALRKMRMHKVGCIAVVDELGGAVGIVTGFDVLTLALQMFEVMRSRSR